MPSISNRITCEPASNVPAHPTSASFHASGPRFTRNSDTMLWLPGGRNAVRSVIKSSRLVRPPMRLVAKPTMISSAGKNAKNKLKAIAWESMPQRGRTRATIRIVRLNREGSGTIARHYTHDRPSVEAKPPARRSILSLARERLLQVAVHHQCIHHAHRRMHKSSWKPANNFKAHALP